MKSDQGEMESRDGVMSGGAHGVAPLPRHHPILLLPSLL